MEKRKFNIVTSTCVPLPVENIDTDQIIPARFLKSTTREGFGENLFRDWRYDSNGSLIAQCPLNDPRYKDGKILVAGKNFGCGSSREHAAWAIADYGFRAVISTFFADIHRNNELNSFVLPVVVSEEFLSELFDSLANDHSTEVEINLPSQTVTNKKTGRCETFEINSYKKQCLMEGIDDIEYLMKHIDDIKKYEENHGNKF
ncbi:MAG: 3-isopropylmalate dehydratase small subunit [Clostridiales bacterium]|nr:3-isopropylmalate dehydratase small subunit [Clostridiales bacterium]